MVTEIDKVRAKLDVEIEKSNKLKHELQVKTNEMDSLKEDMGKMWERLGALEDNVTWEDAKKRVLNMTTYYPQIYNKPKTKKINNST